MGHSRNRLDACAHSDGDINSRDHGLPHARPHGRIDDHIRSGPHSHGRIDDHTRSGPHSRGHSHTHTHTDAASKNIVVAFFLNLGFAVVELVGGLLTNSVAILSDALHDLGDSASLGVAWIVQKRSGKGRDNKFSYGYKRFSLLGSVFLSGVLLVSSIFIVTEAVERLASPQPVHAGGMFWLAVAGVVINGIAVLRLKKGRTLNERAVFLHMMEDVLGWLAVMVASVVMMFVHHPFTRLLDPLLSIGITVWVLWNVSRNLRDTFRILLQGIPGDIDTRRLTSEILAVEGVEGVHDLHLWSQDGQTHVMTLHVVVCEGLDPCDIRRIKEAVRATGRNHSADHVTVEFETVGGECEYAGDDK